MAIKPIPGASVSAHSSVSGLSPGLIKPGGIYTPPYKPPTPPVTPPAPTIGTFAEAVYAQLGFPDIIDAKNLDPDGVTLSFLGAIGQAFQQMDELAHPIDPDGEQMDQWGLLMDIDAVPDEGLAWFGQFSGATLDPNLSTNDQRQQIRNKVGWQRGTPATMAAAIQAQLTGTKTVVITERDTSPYHFSVSTYSTETPDKNQVTIAINATKPAGLQYTYTLITGAPGSTHTYQIVFIDYSSYAAMYNANQSYTQVYNVT